jgi:hypothetical protein
MKTAIATMIMTGALLAGCVAAAPAPIATPTQAEVVPSPKPVWPTEVPSPTPTPPPTHTPGSANTPTPPALPTPTPTIRPSPVPGTWIWEIGWKGTYQVWVDCLELVSVGSCRSFICPGDDHNHYYHDNWVYVGEGSGTRTFKFPGQFTDVLITWGSGDRWAFDGLIGHVGADRDAGYGYTVDGAFAASYLDGSALGFETVIRYEDAFQPMPEPCGIVGPAPDSNYIVTGYQRQAIRGGMLLRMLSLPWDELWARRAPNPAESPYPTIGDFCYSLTGITVYVKPASELGPNDIVCP